jgi:phosphatidylglycerol:prolipoprotein diacylglycerol transferase
MQSEFIYHSIDPVALSIAGFDIYWYSVMYLVAFGQFWLLGRIRARREGAVLKPEQVGDLLFWGVIGVLVALWGYGRSLGCGFMKLGDFVAPLIPLGLAVGRLGNYIGGELWGRLSQVPWAVIFPDSIQAGGRHSEQLYRQYESGALDAFARHPSQLYQALLEGLALFVVVWLFSSRPRPTGAVGGVFLLGYGVFRFTAEFFREPDAHLGFVVLDWMTMGQILSIPMMLIGIGLLVWAYGNTKRMNTGS